MKVILEGKPEEVIELISTLERKTYEKPWWNQVKITDVMSTPMYKDAHMGPER